MQTHNENDPASGMRHRVVLVAALTGVLLYLDRFCISFAEIFIKEDLGLSDMQIGWVLSAFFWTYALGQVPSGWLTDRFGARTMLTGYVLLWSLFTGLTGLATGLTALIAIRLGFGLAQSGAYPTCASLISRWVPLSNRGTASSLVAVGGRFGGALAPLLTGYLIVMFVPLSIDSHLADRDLLDAGQLSRDLSPPLRHRAETDVSVPTDQESVEERSKRRFGRAIKPFLSDATQSAIVASRSAERRSATASAAELRHLLVIDLNRVLTTRDFLSVPLLAEVALPSEAKRLLAADRNALSPAQVQRLNRLALEAVFPKSIRKIYGAGWRQVMFGYGGLGLLVAGIFWLVFRNTPREHPRCNQAERSLIALGRPKSSDDPKTVGRAPVMQLIKSRSMGLLCLSQWCANVGWVFLVTWLPRYLEAVYRVPIEQRAWLTLIPIAVGWCGMVLGGRLTDALVGRVGLLWGRRLPIVTSRLVAMAAYLVCLADPPLWLTVTAFSVVAFSTDLGTGSIWAYMQDVGDRHVGSVLGWGNMWGNFGAAIAPPLLIWTVGESQNWNAAILICAIAFAIAGIAALGIDATSAICADEQSSGTEQ